MYITSNNTMPYRFVSYHRLGFIVAVLVAQLQDSILLECTTQHHDANMYHITACHTHRCRPCRTARRRCSCVIFIVYAIRLYQVVYI